MNRKNKIAFIDTITSQLINTLFNNGFEVSVVDRKNSIASLLSINPDLIVLDPAYGSIELIDQIKTHSRLQSRPLIIMTREPSQQKRLQVLSKPIEDYIAKPFYAEELIARIEGLLFETYKRNQIPPNTFDKTRGSLKKMPLPDLVQMLEIGNQSASIHLQQEQMQGKVWIEKGMVINAQFRNFNPLAALYKLVLWSGGTFRISFECHDIPVKLEYSSKQLYKQHAKRRKEYLSLLQTFPNQRRFQLKDELIESVKGKSVAAAFINPETVFRGSMLCDADALPALRQITIMLEQRILLDYGKKQKKRESIAGGKKESGNPVVSLFHMSKKKIIPFSLQQKLGKKSDNQSRVPRDLLKIKNNN